MRQDLALEVLARGPGWQADSVLVDRDIAQVEGGASTAGADLARNPEQEEAALAHVVALAPLQGLVAGQAAAHLELQDRGLPSRLLEASHERSRGRCAVHRAVDPCLVLSLEPFVQGRAEEAPIRVGLGVAGGHEGAQHAARVAKLGADLSFLLVAPGRGRAWDQRQDEGRDPDRPRRRSKEG